MVQSRFNKATIWITGIATVLLCLLVLFTLAQPLLNYKILGVYKPSGKEYIVLSLALLFSFVFLCAQFWRDVKKITIDTVTRTISFKNLLTKKEEIYSFADFDGFIDMYQQSRQGSFRVIYLIQDKKYRKKISSFYYANLDELQAALHPIKYKGRKPFSFWKSLKTLLGQEVMD